MRAGGGGVQRLFGLFFFGISSFWGNTGAFNSKANFQAIKRKTLQGYTFSGDILWDQYKALLVHYTTSPTQDSSWWIGLMVGGLSNLLRS